MFASLWALFFITKEIDCLFADDPWRKLQFLINDWIFLRHIFRDYLAYVSLLNLMIFVILCKLHEIRLLRSAVQIFISNKRSHYHCRLVRSPRSGPRVAVEKIDSTRFLAECRKRRLNNALSVLCLILDLFWLRLLCTTAALTVFCVYYVVVCSVP